MSHLAIIGNGAWGCALAIALSSKVTTLTLIGRQFSAEFLASRKHLVLSKALPANVILTTSYTSINPKTAVLIATPSHAFATVVSTLSDYHPQTIAWATKGFYQHTLLHYNFIHTLPHYPCCVISGPSFATEVADARPTALVVASSDTTTQQYWATLFTTVHIRPYFSQDVVGVELGGALKNIYAIAAGVIAGLGFGTNALSALITRSLAEMTRFAVCFEANEHTFMGLSGLGDLTLTCFDDASRNRRFGKYIASGMPAQKALLKVGATVEGLYTLAVVRQIAIEKHICMPIVEQIYAITNGDITAKDAITTLLMREITTE